MDTATSPAASPSVPGTNQATRILVAALGLMFLPAGVQGALWPRSFYDDFPLGRGWIVGSAGPYNEHLVRDVGALFLALAIVSIWAWWRPALCLPASVAWLVQGALHLAFHIQHLDALDGIDRIGMLGSLVFVPLASLAALAGELRRRQRS